MTNAKYITNLLKTYSGNIHGLLYIERVSEPRFVERPWATGAAILYEINVATTNSSCLFSFTCFACLSFFLSMMNYRVDDPAIQPSSEEKKITEIPATLPLSRWLSSGIAAILLRVAFRSGANVTIPVKNRRDFVTSALQQSIESDRTSNGSDSARIHSSY